MPEDITTVIKPKYTEHIQDEKAVLWRSLNKPIEALPLRNWFNSKSKVCITFTDITRATPNNRIIPWLLEYLSFIPPKNITLLNSLGSHRPNTTEELEKMLSPEVTKNYKIVHNDPENKDAHIKVGFLKDNTPALISRHLVEADVKIITGFIEPHFFAGFSGGPKGVLPGVAHIDSIMANHRTENIAHPNATFGITDGNPIWEEMKDIALKIGPSFLINVTLNDERKITGIFAGDIIKAHKKGTEFVKANAMQQVNEKFDIVITTNSGYPLDLNLYQGVKGMSAAAKIVKKGGAIILACECRDGIPFKSSYEKLLHSGNNPDNLLQKISESGGVIPDQWQVQIQAQIQKNAIVYLYSSLPDDIVKSAHFIPTKNIERTVSEIISARGGKVKIAVLPQGPLTIPYLAES
ncbi:MAG TPA: nickel-dependent lactate racemase [Verrucomicrobiota bacterium]|nr:nickel-dependent lactate racemase [Verrucomicrobiota bacterium]